MHEAAALRTPLLLVPGPINEATMLAERLAQEGAVRLLRIGAVTTAALADALSALLANSPANAATLDRAAALITGGGGADAAARIILDVAAHRRAGRNTFLPAAAE